MWQFLKRCVEWGGLYQDIERGIPKGASLSPLLGAFYLLDLDRKMARLDVTYMRYMDDILILAKTRWKLKKAIKALNHTFDELKLEKHPEKTVIGRIEKGFDFLGYHISPEGLSLAKKTVENFTARAPRLSEQEPEGGVSSHQLGLYVRRWCRWVHAGFSYERSELDYQGCWHGRTPLSLAIALSSYRHAFTSRGLRNMSAPHEYPSPAPLQSYRYSHTGVVVRSKIPIPVKQGLKLPPSTERKSEPSKHTSTLLVKPMLLA